MEYSYGNVDYRYLRNDLSIDKLERSASALFSQKRYNKEIRKRSDMKYMDWDNMHTRLEALYILDNALTDPSEDDLRLVRKKKLDSNLKYVIDNGAGDSLSVIFTETVVLVKGFAHENSLNQFAADEWNQSIIDKMYEGLDEKLMNLFSVDERAETTFFIWYDGEVHQNQTDEHDGGYWLLGYAFDAYERFR